MGNTECNLCHINTSNTPPVCDYCWPETCFKCTASHITYTDDHNWKCSHGCEYSTQEYLKHKLQTTILNGTPIEKLALAGKRAEVIIPNGTPITPHSSQPDTLPETRMLTTHYTSAGKREKILKYSPQYPAQNRFDFYDNTIRSKALYGWPQKPEYTEEHFSWDTKEHLFFEVPKNEVYISSYRFLNIVKPNSDLEVPFEKYKSELTFHPDQLKEACKQYGRPCEPSDLLYD